MYKDKIFISYEDILCRKTPLRCRLLTESYCIWKLLTRKFLLSWYYYHYQYYYYYYYWVIRVHTALAGKALSMTGVAPLYSDMIPSVLIISAKTLRIPLGYFPSGAVHHSHQYLTLPCATLHVLTKFNCELASEK